MELKSGNLTVNYIRDGLVEEYHTGIFQFGGEEFCPEPFYLRSCAKPLQSSLLVDYGIDFSPKEITLCSGSHAGENQHIELAESILLRLGLDESFLKCGIHEPLSQTMRNEMLLRGLKPSQLHNNCSGKHIGFLAVCQKNGWDLETYFEPQHRLQIEVKRKIAELCEIQDIYNYPSTTDGCGVPIVSMPLHNLVKGYINLNKKYPQIVNAILNNPYIYGGENRLDTEIIQNTNGILAKVGAGGLCVVLNTKTNEAFAVKMNDASTEARRIAVLEIINRLGWGRIKYDNIIKTISGKAVGKIEVPLPGFTKTQVNAL